MTVVSNPNEYSVEGLVDTGSGNQRVIMTQSVEGTQQAYSETSVECIVEDSSGNKQRCVCVNNFGEGGGGSIDYNRVVEKISTMPSVDGVVVGKVYMYVGETGQEYTHGYIYESVETETASAVSFSSNNITWAVADFIEYLKEGGDSWNEVTHGTLVYDFNSDLWVLTGFNSNNIQVIKFQEYTGDLEQFGCVFTTQPQAGDTSTFTLTTTVSGKKWRRLDVQPSGQGGGVTSVNGQTGAVTLGADDVLPSQTGNSGKYLTTNGTNASWGSISALQNSATGTNATNILGSQYGGTASNSTSVGINSLASGQNSTSFGYMAWVGNSRQRCIAIGASSAASGGDAGVAIGASSVSNGIGTICIGYGSLSAEPGTLNIGITTDGFSVTTYKLLNSDGTIPAARHATLPVSDGIYTLKLTISGGVPTLSWVAD
ncbi:MAG: hypothetical protein J6T10_30305 [Methanobrevibacter sp.]|nr:hypothetical protein [Methanobrevibacter sp.]